MRTIQRVALIVLTGFGFWAFSSNADAATLAHYRFETSGTVAGVRGGPMAQADDASGSGFHSKGLGGGDSSEVATFGGVVPGPAVKDPSEPSVMANTLSLRLPERNNRAFDIGDATHRFVSDDATVEFFVDLDSIPEESDDRTVVSFTQGGVNNRFQFQICGARDNRFVRAELLSTSALPSERQTWQIQEDIAKLTGWHHFAVVMEQGQEVQLFIDGVGKGPKGQPYEGNYATVADLAELGGGTTATLGGRDTHGMTGAQNMAIIGAFQGTLDELRWSDTALQPSEFLTASDDAVEGSNTGAGGAAEHTGQAKSMQSTDGSSLEAARPIAEACREAIIRVAAASAGKPYGVKTDRFLIIGNDQMAAGFSRKTGELVALVDVANGGVLTAVVTGSLWSVILIDAPGNPSTVTSADARRTTHKIVEGENDRVELVLKWPGVAKPNSNGSVSVTAMVSAEAGSDYLRWRAQVGETHDKLGLWEVDFPRIASLVPTDAEEQSQLLLPWGTGRVVPDPFGKDATFEGQYPGPTAPMQFFALYGPDSGLYLATHDGEMFIKRNFFECDKDSRAITYRLNNLPENRGVGCAKFEMPYDFVTTTFKGDWFTACELYRDWATQQVWCSKGPLSERDDVPQWYKRIGWWTLTWEHGRTLDDITQIASVLGDVPLAVHLYGWHKWHMDARYPDYFPPKIGDEAFKKQIEQIHQVGARVIPYINGSVYDKELPSYTELNVKQYCVADPAGNTYNWRIDHTARYEQGDDWAKIHWLDWPCPATDFWHKEMRDISAKLVGDYGVDGVYYDVLSGNAHECFSPNHGHTVGGGNYWATGYRELLRQCRDAIRAKNPEAVMTSEGATEIYIDVLDSMLLYMVQQMPGTVPAFQAVYHDYCILFGNYVNNGDEGIRSAPLAVGTSFIAGDQLGWFNLWVWFFLESDHPRKQELIMFLKDEAQAKRYLDFKVHVARLRHYAAYKFLALGRMLEPLTYENELPVVEGDWGQMRQGPHKMPAVIHSVWEASDGTLGLVFCNVSDQEQEVVYTLDPGRYGLPPEQRYVVVQRDADGNQEVLGTYEAEDIKRTERLAPLRGLVLEVRPEAAE